MQDKKISQKEICEHLNIGKQAFTDWKSGKSESYKKYLPQIADFLGVSIDYLLGKSEQKEKTLDVKSNAIFLDDKKIHMIPLFESVSAGFGSYANDLILDYVPLYISDVSEANETLCIRVRGGSMYPKIEDGDIIQVHKQTSVDSGSIAVVLLDGEEGLVKRVEYGPTWIELHSINPMYPVQRFEGPEVLRLQVVGLVRKIIKEV